MQDKNYSEDSELNQRCEIKTKCEMKLCIGLFSPDLIWMVPSDFYLHFPKRNVIIII